MIMEISLPPDYVSSTKHPQLMYVYNYVDDFTVATVMFVEYYKVLVR